MRMSSTVMPMVMEGAHGEIGYYMRWFTSQMSPKEAFFLLRMNDVYGYRMPWKRENKTTERRLQDELGRVIFGSSEAEWRWTSIGYQNSSKSAPRKAHSKASLTDNGPLGAPPARVRKGRKVPEASLPSGVAKVFKAASVLVAETVRHTVVPTVAEVGFGFGKIGGDYDILYCCRRPNKKATGKLLAHIEKEIMACQIHRQRTLLTRHTASAKS